MKPLEIQILKKLDQIDIGGKGVLAAVSGGLDSVALVNMLHTILPRRRSRLCVAYIHHGPSQDTNVAGYREQALSLVKGFCSDHNLDFLTVKCSVELHSEAEFRSFRQASLEKLRQEKKLDFIALAHHADDLLETRVMRLLRGVGPQGLPSMSTLMGVKLRPFLDLTKQQLKDYAEASGLRWLDDPSNNLRAFERNWVRGELLPFIEAHKKGSLAVLSRSLENLARANAFKVHQECVTLDGIDRSRLVLLTERDQRRVIAFYLLKNGIKDYSVSHVNEILKRLDTSKKEFRFSLLKRVWLVDAKRLKVES